MAIARKPVKLKSTDEQAVQSIIEKGGSVTQEQREPRHEPNFPDVLRVQLRLESTLLKKVDDLRSCRAPRPSRHLWFLEAIHEKIRRDSEIESEV